MKLIYDYLTDRICELQNYIDGFPQEVVESSQEVENARNILNELEVAKCVLDCCMV